MMQRQLTVGRKLDAGNPNPGNLGSDFGRLLPTAGKFWLMVLGNPASAVIKERQEKLEELNKWRNAIAHQDWSEVGNSSKLRLQTVQGWRSACNMLARRFDAVMRAHLKSMTGKAPW
jgi:hypothetical protein